MAPHGIGRVCVRAYGYADFCIFLSSRPDRRSVPVSPVVSGRVRGRFRGHIRSGVNENQQLNCISIDARFADDRGSAGRRSPIQLPSDFCNLPVASRSQSLSHALPERVLHDRVFSSSPAVDARSRVACTVRRVQFGHKTWWRHGLPALPATHQAAAAPRAARPPLPAPSSSHEG